MIIAGKIEFDPNRVEYPKFDLARLLRTVFEPTKGKRFCVLTDLPKLGDFVNYKFLQDKSLPIQKKAYDVFFKGLNNSALDELEASGGEFFAYKQTGGSNLDMDDEAIDPSGKRLSLAKDIFPNYDIILCVSTFSATAPLTENAKRFGFRGATMHGVNDVILASGLAVDYQEVSEQTEKLRLAVTRAERIEIDFTVDSRKGQSKHKLKVELGGQEAQKSHGLCRGETPDVANLPAGEVYFVPTSAEGEAPMKYDDGTLAIMRIEDRNIISSEFISGNRATVEEHNALLKADPMTGTLGELGLGTQVLPVAGADIQDEKALGTCHIATGRDDHLGGDIVPSMFTKHEHASHDDILFAPHKTPEINVDETRVIKDGKSEAIIVNYQPTAFFLQNL